jgi:hypothetical protein
MSLPGRLQRICTSPHSAMRAAAALGAGGVVLTWVVLLLLWAAPAAVLLQSATGRQAVVDERVRVVEALGGTIDDADYAALQARPPYWIYLGSGGRALLLPVVTLVVAAGLALWPGRGRGFVPALSVAVHASTVLVLQQLVATPLHLLRESLTSPFNLAALVPFFDEGSVPARVLGTVELFGLWWVLLLAVGAGVLAERRARDFVLPLVGVYVGIAAAVAVAVAMGGGS